MQTWVGAYLCTMKQVEFFLFFFPLTEPEDGHDHTIFRNGMLLSPSCTEFRALSQAEAVQHLDASGRRDAPVEQSL